MSSRNAKSRTRGCQKSHFNVFVYSFVNLLKTASLNAAVLINRKVLGELSNKDVEQRCYEQKDLRIERNEAEEIEIMGPTHSIRGSSNDEVTPQLRSVNQGTFRILPSRV